MDKTVLCYGDSNTWGAIPMTALDDVRRFTPAERWTGVLQRQLAAGYRVIEEGLNGRTTVHSDPIEGIELNGKTYLLPCLNSHRPIDLVVLMLGTNDLKKRFSLSPFDIAAGAEVLVKLIRSSEAGPALSMPPQVLLVCPPPLAKLDLLAEMFEGGREKSQHLAPHYRRVAQTHGCAFFEASTVIQSSMVDGIHFDRNEHAALGGAIAEQVYRLLD